jgi:multiple sugar transport system permease protein
MTPQLAGSARAPARRRGRRWTRYSSRTFYLFVSPWVIGFIAFTIIPMIYAFAVSLTNFNGISGRWRLIGWSNYQELLSDPDVRTSLIQTLVYMIIIVPLTTALGMGLALLLNWRVRGIMLFRTIFYLPSVVPVVAAAITFKLVFDRNSGLANALLIRLGGNALSWLLDPYAFWVLVFLVLWGVGGGMVIFLAGLQGIPQELLEAASVDGAGPVRKFVSITFPLLTPVIFFQVIIGGIFALQTLVQPLLLTAGTALGGGTGLSPDPTIQGTYLYMVNVYEQFFVNLRYGYGSALLWVLFTIILLITLVVVRTGALWVYYDVDVDRR